MKFIIRKLVCWLYDLVMPPKPKWTEEDRVRWIKKHFWEDTAWLSHDPIAKEIFSRYSDMLQDDWMHRSVEDIRIFRERLGLRKDGMA